MCLLSCKIMQSFSVDMCQDALVIQHMVSRYVLRSGMLLGRSPPALSGPVTIRECAAHVSALSVCLCVTNIEKHCIVGSLHTSYLLQSCMWEASLPGHLGTDRAGLLLICESPVLMGKMAWVPLQWISAPGNWVEWKREESDSPQQTKSDPSLQTCKDPGAFIRPARVLGSLQKQCLLLHFIFFLSPDGPSY